MAGASEADVQIAKDLGLDFNQLAVYNTLWKTSETVNDSTGVSYLLQGPAAVFFKSSK